MSQNKAKSKIGQLDGLELTPLLKLSGITKSFPGILANDTIDLTVKQGEIHALLGENGAGKSTLVKIIYGLLKPDAGTFEWEESVLSLSNPAQARALGIGMVFQHFSLFEALTVCENIAIADDQKLNLKTVAVRIKEVSNRYGLPIDPDRYVHSLSVGEKQRIEILRCLLQRPKLLILDEPTSVLTPQEASNLFVTLENLASSGCAILYISHKLEEVRSLCGTATILRNGAVVATCNPKLETAKTMAELMIGVKLHNIKRSEKLENHDNRLQINKLNLKSNDPFGMDLKNISFDIQEGEVLGIAGVAGNGQTELMAALSGEVVQNDSPDNITFDHVCVSGMGVAERRAMGASFVPEERYGHAAIKEMSLKDNALLTTSQKINLVKKGFLQSNEICDLTQKIISDFDVRTTGLEMETGNLSGGNLQKFILGREILQNPRILIVSQPTWGVDAGAAVFLRKSLLDLAARGCAILIISQDLDEIFEICDRIAVLYQGTLSPSITRESASVHQIGLLMGGKTGE